MSGGGAAPGAGSPLKRRVARFVTNRLVNPVVRPLLERGLFPGTHALLETTGRKSGQPRRTPVGNGLRGDVFWIVTEHGYGSAYVKNIQADPRVRVKVGRRWHEGTAQILADDDPRQRHLPQAFPPRKSGSAPASKLEALADEQVRRGFFAAMQWAFDQALQAQMARRGR